jgi:nucleotidyltransferase substrate binding protein (TIGR01987 family)
MSLDTASLARSIDALASAVALCEDRTLMATLGDAGASTMRAGAIQHFEFTYELCWKMMRRWLERNDTPDEYSGLSRRELFRRAARHGLIGDINPWLRYHEARNLTSHTYAAETAERVYRELAAFVGDARSLLAVLEARHD